MKQVWNKVMSTSKRQRQRVKHREKFINFNAIGRTVPSLGMRGMSCLLRLSLLPEIGHMARISISETL